MEEFIVCQICGVAIRVLDFAVHVGIHAREPAKALVFKGLEDVKAYRDRIKTLDKTIKPDLTFEDLRQNCFPSAYTWWTKPAQVTPAEPIEKVKGMLGKIMSEWKGGKDV